MSLLSVPFLLFFLVTLIVYLLLNRKAQNLWLLIASYVFYVTLSWKYALALAVVTLVNYVVGQRVTSRRWLWIGLLFNLTAFSALKGLSGPYGTRLLPLPAETLALLLPVGFSFYILQAIAYLVDRHHRQSGPADDLVDFALYLAYFPKLLSGPIERPARFLDQLRADRPLQGATLARGLGLILIGLIRKVVIADRLRLLLPPNLFSDPSSFSSPDKLFGLIVFTVSLYNDFAGYTSLVQGLSALMGIELSPNFRQPFFATSFSDFWTRWHISLSFWLRDYIFFPLRRWLLQHRRSTLAVLIPPLITMLASGFWHGAHLAMIAWGALHGLYLIGEQGLKPRLPALPRSLQTILPALIISSLVTLAFALFAAPGLQTGLLYLQGLVRGPFHFTLPLHLPDLLLAIALSFWLDRREAHHASQAFFLHWSPRAQAWGLTIALWLLLLFLGPQANVVTFVYQGF